jgi:hypothetical protein
MTNWGNLTRVMLSSELVHCGQVCPPHLAFSFAFEVLGLQEHVVRILDTPFLLFAYRMALCPCLSALEFYHLGHISAQLYVNNL